MPAEPSRKRLLRGVLFPPLVPGRLVTRYKRFLADVLLDSGELVTAHCANPGSMKSLLEPLPRVWLSVARPGRKLGYTWELIERDDAWIYVNPAGANRLVREAIESRHFEEFDGYEAVRAEVKYGAKSRVDFVLEGARGRAFVEVKHVTLSLGEGRAAFPDAVTTRGTRHLEELAVVAAQGARALLVFSVGRTDARSVEPAALIDPVYARTLREVTERGVEVLAIGGSIDVAGIQLDRRVPVIL